MNRLSSEPVLPFVETEVREDFLTFVKDQLCACKWLLHDVRLTVMISFILPRTRVHESSKKLIADLYSPLSLPHKLVFDLLCWRFSILYRVHMAPGSLPFLIKLLEAFDRKARHDSVIELTFVLGKSLVHVFGLENQKHTSDSRAGLTSLLTQLSLWLCLVINITYIWRCPHNFLHGVRLCFDISGFLLPSQKTITAVFLVMRFPTGTGGYGTHIQTNQMTHPTKQCLEICAWCQWHQVSDN